MALPGTWTDPDTEEQAVGAVVPADRLNAMLGNLKIIGGATGAVGNHPVAADVVTSQTETSTAYVDLATPGPAVTVTPGVARTHLIIHSCEAYNNGGYAMQSVAVGGVAAVDGDRAQSGFVGTAPQTVTRMILAAAQASGAVHTCKYRVDAGTGGWGARRIVAIAV